jgi:hypothetical protein
VTPPVLAGRDEQLDSLHDALDDGPGAPGRAILFTGVRGAGKTVMLNEAEDIARQHGWLIISETSRIGLAAQVANSTLPALLTEHAPDAVITQVTGLSGSVAGIGGSVSRQRTARFPATATLRSRLEALTEALAPHGTGVLISLDEVHQAAISDLREIIQTVQHAFRDGREVALVAAGLPSSVNDLLSDDVLTFLRRAERFHLGAVDAADVRTALQRPIEQAGRQITDAALAAAVDATQGYPFLVQLVGYQTWNVDRAAPTITAAHVTVAVERAVRRVGRLVHEPSLAGLSEVDRSFLVAMAADDGPSRIATIAERLQVSSTYASQYRLRLIAAELIEPAGRGMVTFTLPYLRDYLREHVASHALDNGT